MPSAQQWPPAAAPLPHRRSPPLPEPAFPRASSPPRGLPPRPSPPRPLPRQPVFEHAGGGWGGASEAPHPPASRQPPVFVPAPRDFNPFEGRPPTRRGLLGAIDEIHDALIEPALAAYATPRYRDDALAQLDVGRSLVRIALARLSSAIAAEHAAEARASERSAAATATTAMQAYLADVTSPRLDVPVPRAATALQQADRTALQHVSGAWGAHHPPEEDAA